MAANTWNPSDKNANITLSNGNLTATCGANASSGVRGTLSHTGNDGKFYFEFHDIGGCDPGAFVCGVATSSFPLNITDAGNANLIAQTANFGNFEGSFFFSNGYKTTNDGTVRAFAIDFNAGKAWYREGATGGWINISNSSASQDPALGNGGGTVTKSRVYFPVFATLQSGGHCTINTSGPFQLTMPSGYKPWDGDANIVVVATPLITPKPVLGTPAIGQVHNVAATALIAPAPVVGAPSLGQRHALSATALIGPAPALATPQLGQAHGLAATALVAPVPLLDRPEVKTSGTVVAEPLTTPAPLLGSPALIQRVAVTAENLTAPLPLLARPTLSVVTTFLADDLVAASPKFGPATLHQRHALLATNLTTEPWHYVFHPVLPTTRRITGDRSPNRIDGRADFNWIEGSP
jgi:hypothetical protein